MLKYIIKRILLMIPVIIGISFVVFSLLELSPSDPAELILGIRATPESLQELRMQLGLDKPFLQRYLLYMWNAVRGNLGESYRTGLPVITELLARLPVTLKLSGLAILIMVVVGLPIGIISAVKQYSVMDNVTLAGALVLSSMPGFWLGTMLLMLFALNLRLFPSVFGNDLKSYILPAVTLAASNMAMLVRLTRSNMLEVGRADYMVMARSKGASEARVILYHSLRNALLPIITIIGMRFIDMLGSAVIIENVFTIPGLGSLAVLSVQQLDIPMVMGEVLMLAVIGGFLNLFVDIIYVYIDPRLKSQYVRHKRSGKKVANGTS